MAARVATYQVAPVIQFPNLVFVQEARQADPIGRYEKMPSPAELLELRSQNFEGAESSIIDGEEDGVATRRTAGIDSPD
jgi:hypothetical protein